MYNPKFLTRNKITSVSMIATSHGNTDSNKLKLIDRNSEQAFKSISGTTGARTITITFSTTTSINRLFVQSVNWKDFTIKYDSAVDFTPSINIVGNTESNLYYEFSSVLATTITITVTDTFVASDVISCGELYIGAEIFEMADDVGGLYKSTPNTEQRIVKLSDGTSYKTYIRRLVNWDITLDNLTVAERANYIALYNLNRREPFVFIPYAKQPSVIGPVITFPFVFPGVFSDIGDNYGEWDGIAGHYIWANELDVDNWAMDIRNNGYVAKIQLLQAGGL